MEEEVLILGRINTDDTMHITNLRVAIEQLGIIIQLTTGRVFFIFYNIGRYTWRAYYNKKSTIRTNMPTEEISHNASTSRNSEAYSRTIASTEVLNSRSSG